MANKTITAHNFTSVLVDSGQLQSRLSAGNPSFTFSTATPHIMKESYEISSRATTYFPYGLETTSPSSLNSSLLQPTSTEPSELSLGYTVAEGIVSLLAILGNALVVYVFCTNRSLRRYRNYYIFALAIADFLVGLVGIPFAVLSSIGLPRNLYGCLLSLSTLMVLCTISILCLVAVSIDRYWATTNPFAYYRHMTTSTSVGIILACWIIGAIIGFLPLFGWYNHEGWINAKGCCNFREVMDYNYLVFLFFATIVFPAILMGCFYGYIYHVVLVKIRQKGNLAPQMRRPSEHSRSGSLSSDNRGTSQISRIIVSEKRREAKAAHKLGIIVLFFIICWMPLYIINCIQKFCPTCSFRVEILNFTIILTHANSSLNPLLYAYHLKEFRIAMKNALLQLFGKLACGRFDDRIQKEVIGIGPWSRSHTLPSLAHAAALANSTGKISMNIRRSPDQYDQCHPFHIAATEGSASIFQSKLHQTSTDPSLASVALSEFRSSAYNFQPQPRSTHTSHSSGSSIAVVGPHSHVHKSTTYLAVSDTNLHMDVSNKGLEIHVVNIEVDCRGSRRGTESRVMGKEEDAHATRDVSVGGKVETNERTNELDPNDATDNQVTTPL